MKNLIFCTLITLTSPVILKSQDMNSDNLNLDKSGAPTEQLTLTEEWDKVFPKSENMPTIKRPVAFIRVRATRPMAGMSLQLFRSSTSSSTTTPMSWKAPC